jgi:endonuclease-3
MATPSKAQILSDVLTMLKKRYKISASTQKFTVLEAVIYGICHEDATRAQADQALEKFKTGFFDWNEVRVSSIAEIQAVLQSLKIPNPEERAMKLRRFLRQLFEKSYGFNLETLIKKPLKDSVKLLQEYEALSSDFVLSTAVRLALGGHAIGIDEPTRRVIERLGVAEHQVDAATLRGVLERAIPKTRGAEFVDLIEELSHDTCLVNPDCPRCELKKVCPYPAQVAAAPKKEPAPAKIPVVKAAAKPVPAPATVEEKPAAKPIAKSAKPAVPAAPVKSAKPAEPAKPPAPAKPAAKLAAAPPAPAPAPAKPASATVKPAAIAPAPVVAKKAPAPPSAPAAKVPDKAKVKDKEKDKKPGKPK